MKNTQKEVKKEKDQDEKMTNIKKTFCCLYKSLINMWDIR